MAFQQIPYNVTDPEWSVQATKTMTFNAKTGSGATGVSTLFNVTGAVLVRFFGKVITPLGQTSSSTSPSASVSPSSSTSPSSSSSASDSPSSSTSPSSSRSPSASVSLSLSPSESESPSASTSPSHSLSTSQSLSRSPSSSASPSSSVSPSSSSSLSRSPSSSVSPSSSASLSLSPSASGSPSASASPSSSASPSASISASWSAGLSGELKVGTATDDDGLLASTEAFSLSVANAIWHDNAPDSSLEAVTVLTQKVVADDIIQTVSTDAIGAGEIDYYCIWYPLSKYGHVEAA